MRKNLKTMTVVFMLSLTLQLAYCGARSGGSIACGAGSAAVATLVCVAASTSGGPFVAGAGFFICPTYAAAGYLADQACSQIKKRSILDEFAF